MSQLKATQSFLCSQRKRERGQQTPTNSNCFRSIAVLPLCAIMCLMSSHLIYGCPPTYTGCFVLSTLNVCNYYSSLLFLSKGSNCTTLKSVLPAIYIHCKTDPLIRMSKSFFSRALLIMRSGFGGLEKSIVFKKRWENRNRSREHNCACCINWGIPAGKNSDIPLPNPLGHHYLDNTSWPKGREDSVHSSLYISQSDIDRLGNCT